MSNLIRWEPMREMMTLREAMDRLFDDAFTRPIGNGGNTWGVPAIDLYQTEKNVIVKAALPGLKADDVQISVTGEILTLNLMVDAGKAVPVPTNTSSSPYSITNTSVYDVNLQPLTTITYSLALAN